MPWACYSTALPVSGGSSRTNRLYPQKRTTTTTATNCSTRNAVAPWVPTRCASRYHAFQKIGRFLSLSVDCLLVTPQWKLKLFKNQTKLAYSLGKMLLSQVLASSCQFDPAILYSTRLCHVHPLYSYSETI